MLEDSFGYLSEFEKVKDEDLLESCQNDCYKHDNFTNLLDEIKESDIKKQILETLAFVYTRLMDFPVSDFSVQPFTSAIFF